MSFLIDTDLLSLLERKHVPAKLTAWVRENEAEIFLSVVSFAELQFGLDRAPATHRPGLAGWLAETRRKFTPATEELTEPVLVPMERAAGRSQEQKSHDDVRGFFDRGHSPFSRPYIGHAQ